MKGYVLHGRSNNGVGRDYRSGWYREAGTTWEEAQVAAHAHAAKLVGEGWCVSRRRVDGSQTWLTKRENGALHRLLLEIEEATIIEVEAIPCRG